MKTLALILLSLSSFTPAAEAVGFSAGSRFTSIRLRGQVTVDCSSAGESAQGHFTCRANLLDPAEFTYLLGPTGIPAKKVALAARHQDGSLTEKTRSYDPKLGRSEEINLWISTLLQRPLLALGTNQIDYSFLDAQGDSIEDGSFSVDVEEGAPRECHSRFYWSNNANDCVSSATICPRFFREQNYCQ